MLRLRDRNSWINSLLNWMIQSHSASLEHIREANMEATDDSTVLQLTVTDRQFYLAAKRAVDILISACLLVVLAPLMLIVALGIRIYSPGPILFVQERVGARRVKGKKGYAWEQTRFKCLKFRTMHVNADSSRHKAYVQALIENDQAKMAAIQGTRTALRKLVQDSRITRPGRILRKFSLDELPQFWNVLRGDMSLVGPRPAIPYEVEMYSPWHLQRLQAQPGITGLQQITARSTASFDEQVRLDLRYIEHQSLWMDFDIILRTPFVVISTRGAR